MPKLVGRRGITTRFISGIDIALWDLMGKATGKSVHQLLGGFRDRVPAYIAGGYYEAGKGLAGWRPKWKPTSSWAPKPSR